MKKIILISILTLILTPIPKAQANDGSTAGAILVGALGVALLADAFSDNECRPVRHYYSQAPVYTSRVNYVAPTSYYPSPVYRPVRSWIPGCYETYTEQVWVSSTSIQVWIEDQYGYEYQCGQRVPILLRPGHNKWQTIPAHYEQQNLRRWIPGHWSN